jgi:hypothetical protein
MSARLLLTCKATIQGAYRDDDGKPVVLDCVREAERRVAGKKNMEYALTFQVYPVCTAALGLKSASLCLPSLSCASCTASACHVLHIQHGGRAPP